MAEELAAPAGRDHAAWRNPAAVLRYVVGVALGCLVLLLLVGKRAEFSAAWRQLGSANPGWVTAATAAGPAMTERGNR